MGMFCQRWLVLYEATDLGKDTIEQRAKIIVDSECKLPHGVIEEDIADDCCRIIAFIALPDDYEPHCVVMNDEGVEVELPKDDDGED